jgi:hypothetical protein
MKRHLGFMYTSQFLKISFLGTKRQIGFGVNYSETISRLMRLPKSGVLKKRARLKTDAGSLLRKI